MPLRSPPRCAVFSSCLSLIVAALAALPVAAADPGCVDGDVWMVSTRRLPGICGIPVRADFEVERRLDGRWVPADLTELLAEPERPLVFFIHGNRYETSDAKVQGVALAACDRRQGGDSLLERGRMNENRLGRLSFSNKS